MIDRARNPERSIPSVAVPDLAELGLGHLRASGRTRLLFGLRPLAAAAGAGAAWCHGWWPVALALVPPLYGWSLTGIHHLIHRSLGCSSRMRTLLLSGLSLLVFESGHALATTHLQHHRVEDSADDPEGYIEALTWPQLLREAPCFRYRLWSWAWPRQVEGRRLMQLEMAWHLVSAVAAAAIAVGALAGAGWAQPILPLPVHVGALHLANTCFALLAAKGPQTNWGRPVGSPLVAVRGRLARYLFLSHTWHLEHHLYPDIPMPYLGLVAERIDQQLAREGAITVVTW